MNNRDKEKSSQITILALLEANAKLAISKAVAVLPTQPFQVMMRVQQGALVSKEKPQFLSIPEAAKKIYQENHKKNSTHALRPFFRGTTQAVSKEALKNGVYKGALITGAPDLANNALAATGFSDLNSPAFHHVLKPIVAGTIAGTSDVLLGGVLESWATYRATSHGVHANASFWQEVRAEHSIMGQLNRAYSGAGPSLIKNNIAFTTYFMTTNPIKNGVSNFYNIQDQKHIPWYAKLTTALLAGGAVAISSSPFDIIKTQSQMPNPSKKPVGEALLSNWKTYGLKGVTAGLPLKFGMITMGWSITHLATDSSHSTPTATNKNEQNRATNKH